MTHPRYPGHGNPFEWIVYAAQAYRDGADVPVKRAVMTPAEREVLRQFDLTVEAAETQRIALIRSRYARPKRT